MNNYIRLNIRYLRKQKKLTQKKVGSDLGFTTNVLPSYESGKNKPTLENAIKIADYFNVSLDMLCRTDLSNAKEILSELHDKSTMRAYLSDISSSIDEAKAKLDSTLKALE